MGKRGQGEKVPVTMRALIQRINRKLASDNEMLRRTRGQASVDLGVYHVIDVSKNAVVGKDIDPEAYGRDLGVLKPWERLVDEGGQA